MLSTAGLDLHDPDTATDLWKCDKTAFCTSVVVRTKLEVVQAAHILQFSVQEVEHLPPFILYKGKNMYKKCGPAAALYGITDSGWMDAANFLSWFVKLFLPAVLSMTGTAPVLLFFDGHHSHIGLELIRKAHENNIIFLCLPPNTTQLRLFNGQIEAGQCAHA